MDENGFIDFMRNAKRSEGTIHRYVIFMKVFEKYIEKQGKTLENATPVDFDSFLKVADPKYRSFSFVSGVRNYYDFIGNDRMKYVLDEHPQVTEYCCEAIRRTGLTPKQGLIRGGTDGSRLSAMGLPTPNIFTGGHNFHSKKEWISAQDMTRAVETIVHLLTIWEETADLA